MNDEELLHKLYYKELILGGVQVLYKAAKQRHPKITIKIVQEWLDKQQAAQLTTTTISSNISTESVFALTTNVNSLSTNSTLSINNLNTTSTTLLVLINGHTTQLSNINSTFTIFRC